MVDQLKAISTEESSAVCVDFTDECGDPIARLTIDGDVLISDLADQAPAFGLPEGDDYALYRIVADPKGRERVERLAPSTRLSDISAPEDDILRLRFAPALKGAR